MRKIYNELAGYLINLLNCALKGVKPEEKPENVTFEDVFKLSYRHSVANLAFYSIEKLENKPEAKLYAAWREIRDKAVVKGITQLYERDLLVEAFTADGIDICPLKGCIIKEMYPSQDMRMMSDLDILMDNSKAKRVGEILIAKGYEREYQNEDGHDVYKKKPVLNIEMHNQLIDNNIQERDMISYYENAWDRLIADEDNRHMYKMNWSDFYIYMFAHFAKHYNSSGSGIRSVMDIYIFRQKHENDLDRAYVKAELEKMKLVDFADKCEKLADIWFGDFNSDEEFNKLFNGNLLEELNEMTEYIVKSGTYGCVENRVDKDMSIAGGSKFSYYMRRTFPPKEKMYFNYRILKKYPYLLPFCWVHRLVTFGARKDKREKIKKEMKIVGKK